MHPLRGLLQPGPVVDGTADHEGLVAARVLDGNHRPGLGFLPQLPELLSDALGDSLGRSVLACIGNEYRHFCSLLSLERHPLLFYLTSRKKSTLRTRLTTIITAINASMATLVGIPLLLMTRKMASTPLHTKNALT